MKKNGRKEIANLIPIRHLSCIVILTLTEIFVKSNFQYNPRWRPRWAPFLMTSQTKSLIFPVQLACQPVKTAVSPRSSPLGKFRWKKETPLTAKNEEGRLYLQTTIRQGSVQLNPDFYLCSRFPLQIAYHSRTKKDNSNSRTVYLSAYEVEEFESWLCSLRLCK